MKNYEVFKKKNWELLRYDGRKNLFKDISKSEFLAAKEKHFSRQEKNHVRNVYEDRRWTINMFANIPYYYQGDGLSDWQMYQRPASDGIGYCAVCPGERGNNIYIDDEILVKYLKSKYEKKQYKEAKKKTCYKTF